MVRVNTLNSPVIRKSGRKVTLGGVLQVTLESVRSGMTVCPQCDAELKAGDPLGLCPVCLLAGAVGSGFTSSERETQTLTALISEAERDSFGPIAFWQSSAKEA